MQEFVKLRVFHGGDHPPLSASLRSVVRDDGGGFVFELPSADPRWKEILEFCVQKEASWRKQRELVKQRGAPQPGEAFGFDLLAETLAREIEERGWPPRPRDDCGYLWAIVKRRYSKKELETAELLRWIPRWTRSYRRPLEMTREIYDRDRQCRMCGAALQIGELLFESQKFPRTRDVLRVGFENEVVVSERFAEILRDARITGATTRRIWERRRRRGAAQQEIPGWRQLTVTAEAGPLSERTVSGSDIFHPDPEGERCSMCGLTFASGIQSELYLPRKSWDGSDVALTRDRMGGRAGTPMQMLLISPRFYQLLLEHEIRGYAIHVAHLV